MFGSLLIIWPKIVQSNRVSGLLLETLKHRPSLSPANMARRGNARNCGSHFATMWQGSLSTQLSHWEGQILHPHSQPSDWTWSLSHKSSSLFNHLRWAEVLLMRSSSVAANSWQETSCPGYLPLSPPDSLYPLSCSVPHEAELFWPHQLVSLPLTSSWIWPTGSTSRWSEVSGGVD